MASAIRFSANVGLSNNFAAVGVGFGVGGTIGGGFSWGISAGLSIILGGGYGWQSCLERVGMEKRYFNTFHNEYNRYNRYDYNHPNAMYYNGRGMGTGNMGGGRYIFPSEVAVEEYSSSLWDLIKINQKEMLSSSFDTDRGGNCVSVNGTPYFPSGRNYNIRLNQYNKYKHYEFPRTS
jgi:hypothetical protein